VTRIRAAILALGAANRRSIESALTRAGASPFFLEDAGDLASCDALVIPGVSNVGFVIGEMEQRALREPLLRAMWSGLPTLGICAGFQVLFECSDEAPLARGLAVFDGRVRRLRSQKLPHMGWNRVESTDPGLEPGWAYFAHTFAAPVTPLTVAQTSYADQRFSSIARRGNVTGVQFHPERSGAYGARFLESFVRFAACVSC
jgi:imidazole glycerol-phosphate synthase subunit HisH